MVQIMEHGGTIDHLFTPLNIANEHITDVDERLQTVDVNIVKMQEEFDC